MPAECAQAFDGSVLATSAAKQDLLCISPMASTRRFSPFLALAEEKTQEYMAHRHRKLNLDVIGRKWVIAFALEVWKMKTKRARLDIALENKRSRFRSLLLQRKALASWKWIIEEKTRLERLRDLLSEKHRSPTSPIKRSGYDTLCAV